MQHNQKGYTLIELVAVLILIGILGGGIGIGRNMMREMTLRAKGSEVARSLEYIKQSAVTTGEQYNIYCFEDRMIVRKGVETPLYTIPLGNHIKIPNDITGKSIRFRGSIAPRDGAATILLVDKGLGKQMRITVSVATGKVRVYEEVV